MTLGMNTAAVEWVHAYLMGLDPQRIPLTREAFVPHRYPRTHFSPNDILTLDKRSGSPRRPLSATQHNCLSH